MRKIVQIAGLLQQFQCHLIKEIQFEKTTFCYSILNYWCNISGATNTSTHYGTIYLGKHNGVLLGFCVGIVCVSFACWKLFIDEWRDDED